MNTPAVPTGLSEIAGRFNAVLCDVWGVVHNGRAAYVPACKALTEFQRDHGPVVLISNSPRPSGDVVAQLRALGVPDSAWSELVTSGDATRTELFARAPGPAWAVGPARDAPLYDGTGVSYAETPEEAAFVSCTGPFDDDVETPEHFRARFEVCVARGLTMVCANPDRVVQRGGQMIYCAGALADLYLELGGEVVMAGKPYAPIYDLGRRAVDRLATRRVDTSHLLAIGDAIATDVKGANNQGVAVMFVGEGIHAAEVLTAEGVLDPSAVAALLDREGVHADYAMSALRW